MATSKFACSHRPMYVTEHWDDEVRDGSSAVRSRCFGLSINRLGKERFECGFLAAKFRREVSLPHFTNLQVGRSMASTLKLNHGGFPVFFWLELLDAKNQCL